MSTARRPLVLQQVLCCSDRMHVAEAVAAADNLVGWRVHRYDGDRAWGELGDLLPGRTPDLASWLRERGGRDGQRFLSEPDDYPDLR
ncbi:hypothetical protein AB0H07_46490 [Streptomyces sp. NPDC021354]|uniref:hypothetical protein n=1 Tax=Streptomyces sp. NPDC021354 TaxID=3154793 RepID=UPI0033CBF9A8